MINIQTTETPNIHNQSAKPNNKLMIPKHNTTKSLGNSVLNKTTLIDNSFQKSADITSADLINMLKQYNRNSNKQKKYSTDKQNNNSYSQNQNDIT